MDIILSEEHLISIINQWYKELDFTDKNIYRKSKLLKRLREIFKERKTWKNTRGKSKPKIKKVININKVDLDDW